MYSALIQQYLHTSPAEDLTIFAQQAGLALALEERFFMGMAAAMAKVMGGK